MPSPSSIDSLKKLSRAFPGTAEMMQGVQQLAAAGNDRALAITCSAILERALEEYVVSNLVWPDDEKLKLRERKALFEGDSPLATFSSKIKIGYALGLYSEPVRSDLDTLRDLRNAFAHAATQINFKTAEVQTVCARLKLHDSIGGLDWAGHPSPSMLKYAIISSTLTGLFWQATYDDVKKYLVKFGISWKLLPPEDAGA